MKIPHTSSRILEINYKSPPCLTEISQNELKKQPPAYQQDSVTLVSRNI